MTHFDLYRPHDGLDDEPDGRRLNLTRLATLLGAMMLAGSFWWFLGRILLRI
ncbi:hypothetical protein [Phenylobacterium soli]|uniref:hypothetical protein n=1 Tax=Phenylobacterium soli TaxID=2170551 RepID=UPI001402121C|nr:hypothetical protein [Phenylobacterium soli]